MSGQTIILASGDERSLATRLIHLAPAGAVVTVREASRTPDQNAKMWAMLSDISRAMPEGRRHTTEIWKALMMNACGHAVQFENGIDGVPFPVGFKTSKLSKAQMSELIEFIYSYGDQHGVAWSEKAAA